MAKYKDYFILLVENGDMGDRMALGLSYNAGGGMSGASGTFTSPDVSQNPSNFYQVDQNKVDGYTSHTSDSPDDSDIDAIKYKVSPDEVMMGIEYELKRMFYKNRSLAKQTVIKHLKEDPKYYSELHMLNFDDPDAVNTVNESNFSETVKVLNAMIKQREKKNAPNPETIEAINDTNKKRKDRAKFLR